MDKPELIEMVIDEESDFNGIEAMSIVEEPAIEMDFITLKKQHEVKLAEVDKEQQILMGPALVPDKPILRRKDDKDYYIYFKAETVKKAAQSFLVKGNQNSATLEHELKLSGMSVVESWIVEDNQMDKAKKYGFDVPNGTWMISMKVHNEDFWQEFIKTGKIKGFSIEGHFGEKKSDTKLKAEMKEIMKAEAAHLVTELKAVVSEQPLELESYSDYPEAVKNNAQRGIDLNKKIDNKCATEVGKIRAQQLAKGEPISKETIKRMFSYLSRAEAYYKEGDNEACGTISFLFWGGKAALSWSESKLKQLDEK